MKYVRALGAYLLVTAAVLLASSVWQMKMGCGRADFSFLIIVPFAIGLVRGRKWGLWGIGTLGVLVSCLVLFIAFIHTVSGLRGFSIGLGPIVFEEPSPVHLWGFAVAVIGVLGLPMMSVFLERNEMDKALAQ